MTKTAIVSLLVTGVMGISPAFASGDHKGLHTHHNTMNADMIHVMGQGRMDGRMTNQIKNHMNGRFLVRKNIDGYRVSFHVLKAPEGTQKHGGTYHFMFKVEKDGKVLTHILVNSKVMYSDGQSESKMMMRMGDWYMAGYNLEDKGKYKIMVLFKTSDGKMHFSSMEYQARGTLK